MKRWKVSTFVLLILIITYLGIYASAIASDNYEDDDTYQNSNNIPTNASVQYHTMHDAADIDWINFSAIAGSLYVIETFNVSASTAIDTHIGLYDTDGTTRLTYNDDIINGIVRRSRIIWNATSTDTFFVNVSELYDKAGGDYNIRITRIGYLIANITSPMTNTNISQGKSFTVNATLTCVDGTCLNITGYLDPIEKGKTKVDKKVNEILNEKGKVKVIVEYKQPELRGMHSAERMDTVSRNIVRSLSKKKGFKLKRQLNKKMLAAEVDDKALEELSSLPEVKAVYYDWPVHAFLETSVPHINADDANAVKINGVNITGTGQTVCVLDTGINYSHADFGSCSRTTNITDGSCGSVVGGYDYVNDDADPYDDNGHGSHVSGIIASQDSTYTGVAPGTTIVAIKVLNAAGSGSTSDVISGIQWCTNQKDALNISVISMSLGVLSSRYNYYCNDLTIAPEMTVVDAAVANNISVFMSAGNEDYTTGISTPSCLENAISVGTINDVNDAFTDNRGVILDIVAPGVNIMATDHDSTHVSLSGTSMATPHVSGTAALLQQYFRVMANRSLTPEEIKHKMRFNAVNLFDSANYLTFPRVDAYSSTVAKGIIPTTVGAEPFYTTSANPSNLSCLEWMTNGTTCNQSWTVHATGTANTTWEFFSAYETEYRFNKSNMFNVTILNTTLVTLNSPSNNSYIANSSVVFNCSATSTNELVNITIYHNMSAWHANSTTVLTGTDNSTLWQLNFSDALYEWNCYACDINDCFSASTNLTFTTDTTYPVFDDVNYTSVIELGNLQNITAQVTSLNLDYVNLSINSTNYTMTLRNNVANYSYLPYYNQTYYFTLYAMDLAGNLNLTSLNFTVNDSIAAPLHYSTSVLNTSVRSNWQQTISTTMFDGYPLTVFLDHNGSNVTMTSVSKYNFTYSWNVSQCSSSITYKIHANNSINQSNYTTGTFGVINCCGNGDCESGESCSSCSADCGECTTTTSSGGGGGGGGGGAVVDPVYQNFIFSSVEKDQELEAKPTSSLIPVSSVTFTSASEAAKVSLRVETVDDEQISKPKNTYKVVKIELPELKINSAKIKFKVPESWLKDNLAAAEDVVMMRYEREGWKELNTYLVNKEGDTYNYVAESPGFSYFSISLKPKEVVVEIEEEEVAEEERELSIMAEEEPVVEEKSGLTWPWVVAVILCTAILSGFVVFEIMVRRKRKRS